MDTNKKSEIKQLILDRWEEEKYSLCRDIEQGYIFGKYANNEHYSLNDIIAIWDEVYLDKNPLPEPVIEEPVIEEPIEE